jgi:uncharacterized protein YndB with AHSA1/START domain
MKATTKATVERSVLIRARRSTVFRYFTDSARFAAWWGPGSSIEGKPGGKLQIRYPNGATAGGEVVELVPDRRIVFTYGYDDASQPIARGGSRVTITLDEHEQGTLLHLVHEVADTKVRDAHIPGWRFQLSLFANVAAAEQHADLAALADRYFASWSLADEDARAGELTAITTPDVTFRDAFATLSDRDELMQHVTASQLHMPGIALRRDGAPRSCQGVALIEWTAHTADGSPAGRGTNVVELSPDGRFAHIVGFWHAP